MSIKGLIEESKKIREVRGEDFFSNTRPLVVNNTETLENENSLGYEKIRKNQIKLNNVIFEFDEKNSKKYEYQANKKKDSKKRLHIFLKESVLEFLDYELEKSHLWKLRKNASYGDIIGAFLERFQIMRERERKQIDRIKYGIKKFSELLVSYKKNSPYPENYLASEEINRKMKELSLELCNLIILYEFEDNFIKSQLEEDQYRILGFAMNWRMIQG